KDQGNDYRSISFACKHKIFGLLKLPDNIIKGGKNDDSKQNNKSNWLKGHPYLRRGFTPRNAFIDKKHKVSAIQSGNAQHMHNPQCHTQEGRNIPNPDPSATLRRLLRDVCNSCRTAQAFTNRYLAGKHLFKALYNSCQCSLCALGSLANRFKHPILEMLYLKNTVGIRRVNAQLIIFIRLDCKCHGFSSAFNRYVQGVFRAADPLNSFQPMVDRL